MAAEIVRTREFDNMIVTDADGRVLLNCAQADVLVIRRDYDDGTADLVNKETGEIMLGPFNPQDFYRLDCPKCGHNVLEGKSGG